MPRIIRNNNSFCEYILRFYIAIWQERDTMLRVPALEAPPDQRVTRSAVTVHAPYSYTKTPRISAQFSYVWFVMPCTRFQTAHDSTRCRALLVERDHIQVVP